jgi:hypothetical protein
MAIAPVFSAALESCHVLKNAAGNLYGFSVYNAGGAAAYIMVFNLAAAPSNGTVAPVHEYPISAGGGVAFSW